MDWYETGLTLVAASWMAVVFTSKLNAGWVEWLRERGRPWSCALCMGFWFGLAAALALGIPSPLQFGLASSLLATLLERKTTTIG